MTNLDKTQTMHFRISEVYEVTTEFWQSFELIYSISFCLLFVFDDILKKELIWHKSIFHKALEVGIFCFF